MSLGYLVNKVLHPLGFRLVRRVRQRSFPALAELEPLSTIIDVGVAHGTPEVYTWFPDARLILVEPNPTYHWHIRTETLHKRNGTLITSAAGSVDSTGTLTLDGPKSSFLERVPLSQADTESPADTVEIEIRPLDRLLESEVIESPALLKIDTEGYELEVLRGATQTLKHVRYILAEVSVVKRFMDSYDFTELCQYLFERDFRVVHILSTRTTESGLIRFVDILFERQFYNDVQ